MSYMYHSSTGRLSYFYKCSFFSLKSRGFAAIICTLLDKHFHISINARLFSLKVRGFATIICTLLNKHFHISINARFSVLKLEGLQQ